MTRVGAALSLRHDRRRFRTIAAAMPLIIGISRAIYAISPFCDEEGAIDEAAAAALMATYRRAAMTRMIDNMPPRPERFKRQRLRVYFGDYFADASSFAFAAFVLMPGDAARMASQRNF